MKLKWVFPLAFVMVCLLSTCLAAVVSNPSLPSQSEQPSINSVSWDVGAGVENTNPFSPPQPTPTIGFVDDASDLPMGIGGGESKPVYPEITATPKPDDEDDNSSGTTTTHTENTHTETRIVLFPFENLEEGIEGSFNGIINRMIKGLLNLLKEVVSIMSDMLFLGDAQFVRDRQKDVWMGMMAVAAVLIPLSLSLVVANAMRHGASSITGYAVARETLIEWAIAIALAASSFVLLSYFNDLSSDLMVAIDDSLASQIDKPMGLTSGDMIFAKMLVIHTPSGETDFGNTILAIFGFIVSFVLMVAIVFAMISREVMLFLSFGLAPIILIIGVVPLLRWIRGMWLKITVVAFLLGPLNVFLIDASAIMVDGFNISGTSDQNVNNIILYILMLGIISVLIGLNGLIGKAVYGSMIEITKLTGKGFMTAFGGLSGAVGFAAGGHINRSRLNPHTRKFPKPSNAGTLAADKHNQAGLAQVRRIRQEGQSMARSSNPGVRGYGKYLQKRSLAHERKFLNKEMSNAFAPPPSPFKGNGNYQQASASALKDVNKNFTEGGKNAVQGRFRTSINEVLGRTSQAHQNMDNMFAAANKLDIDLGGAMAGFNYQTGGDLDAALQSFSRYGISRMSFPNREPEYSLPSGPISTDAHVMNAGIEIASQRISISGAASEWTQERFQDLYNAIYTRLGKNESYDPVIEGAVRANSIVDWMKNS